MRFFGPTSTPLLNEETAPMVRRALLRARVMGNFVSMQVVVQGVGFASGILLVRYLDQQQYAYFTIANTMQGTINVLADIGISIGLISIGGRVWKDRGRFSQLIATARRLRWRLGGLAVLLVTPILYFMLARNGASFSYSLALIALLLVGVSFQLSLSIFSVVLRLRSEVARLQRIELAGGILRIIALVGCAFVLLNAAVAVLIGAVAFFLQYWLTRRSAAASIDLHAPGNEEDRQAMFRFIKSQAPNALFFCLQGQITIYLISFFGSRVGAVAEIGALGRLAMIFAIFGQLLTNIFVPAFARAESARRLYWQYSVIVGAVVLFSAGILAAATMFPQQFLFVLGQRYAHLDHELVLMVASTCANVFVATLWVLNASRAWVTGSWLYIPLTLATQIGLIPFTDFSSVRGVLLFNLVSNLPNLLVNIMLSWRGFRSLPQEQA